MNERRLTVAICTCLSITAAVSGFMAGFYTGVNSFGELAARVAANEIVKERLHVTDAKLLPSSREETCTSLARQFAASVAGEGGWRKISDLAAASVMDGAIRGDLLAMSSFHDGKGNLLAIRVTLTEIEPFPPSPLKRKAVQR